MHRILIAAAVTVSTLCAAGVADAQYYYYDRGYYPPPPPPPPYYGGRYYDGPRYAPAPSYGGWRPAYVDRHGQQTYYPGRRGSCPRGYTVQDGVCKPYRGF
jgi:hypothetical protein